MKKRFFVAMLCLSGSLLFLYIYKTNKIPVADSALPVQTGKLPKQDRIDLAIEYEYQITKDPALNGVPRERLLQAVEVRNELIAARSSSRILGAVSGISWQERGPNNVGGRTRALMFDLNDGANGFKKVWAGGVGGGLWYTNDITAATPIWNKVDDFLENLAVTSIVQNPENPQEIYVGTGEGWFNLDAIKGLGIWKTTNGGANWSRLTSTNNMSYVNDMLIDNNGALYAAVRQYYSSDAAGVMKSVNGGITWTQVLGSSANGSVRAGDLELSKDGDIYVSTGFGDAVGAIFISDASIHTTNTGNAGTWTEITPNTTGVITPGTTAWRRIELATAPSDNNVVYALFQGGNSNDVTGIQQYNKFTNTWTVRTVPTIIDQGSNSNFSRGQAWYDLIAAVDPNNANSLYIGGVDALRSDNNGQNWTQMTTWSLYAATGFNSAQNVHADHHAIVYAPGSSSIALWGTDGGVHYTANANITTGKPTFISKNNGYNVTQYYAVAAHPTNTNYFLAGAQDNGTQKFTANGINTTTDVSGGDGAFCHIDQDDPSIQISSYVYNNYYLSLNGGASFSNQRFFANTGGFINPTDYDDADNKLYGGNVGGTYFRWNDPAAGGTSSNSVSVSQFGTASVTHVSVSPLTPYRVYFGLNNGSVVQVDNAHVGTAATGKVIRTGPGSVSVSGIAVDPKDENHMLITYSNYGVVSIYESFNANSNSPTWASVEGNLPDMPVRWVIFDPRNSDWALIATELGVWSTDNLNGSGTDWQPTNSGFANVRVDMLQYRSSDRTLVAATHGRGLFTTTIPAVSTPEINFTTATSTTTEQTSASVNCLGYRDINVTMGITNAPAGDAIATLNVNGGNSAVKGVDFDFTTNGNFNNSSNTVTFASGSTALKTITIRIYDDAEVESTETFTLSYSLSGGTNAQTGQSFQTHAVGITSNDVAPVIPINGSYTVGSFTHYLDFETPFYSSKLKHRTQVLFTKAELNAAGITSATNLTSLKINVSQKNSTKPFNGFTISMINTSASTLAYGYTGGTFTQVYSSNYSTVLGNNIFNFITPFAWDGTSNIVIQFCFDNSGSSDALNDYVEGIEAPIGPDGICTVFSNYSSGSIAGCILNAVYISDMRIKAIFTANGGNAIATALNVTKSEALNSNNDLYYYSPTGEIMARIRNLSTHNYGCTQVTVDRAGTSAVAFWNNITANYLLSKTYQVEPTTNNTSGSYQITLYYTQAEVQAWETATGQSWVNVQLIKLPSQIKNYTPATPLPDGADAVQTVIPTHGTFGTQYTLTYTFNTGFSGFGVGVPGIALPVTLLHFDGKLLKDAAFLDWATSAEQNSRQFEIEKSTDGNTYRTIGVVKAAGNSSENRAYKYADQKLSEMNYYRLKMVDQDGKFTYSRVVLIRNNDVHQNMWIVTNPFKNVIDLRFAKVPQQRSDVQISDMNGKLVYRSQLANNSDNARIDLSNISLGAGTYVLKVTIDGKAYSAKVVKL